MLGVYQESVLKFTPDMEDIEIWSPKSLWFEWEEWGDNFFSTPNISHIWIVGMPRFHQQV